MAMAQNASSSSNRKNPLHLFTPSISVTSSITTLRTLLITLLLLIVLPLIIRPVLALIPLIPSPSLLLLIELERLQDGLRNRRRRRQMSTLSLETVLIGRILHRILLSIGSGEAVRTLSGLEVGCLLVTLFLRRNSVVGFVGVVVAPIAVVVVVQTQDAGLSVAGRRLSGVRLSLT